MTTFVTRYDTAGTGVRLAVKDLIDMEGERTLAGCRAVERTARPAARDAACLAGARAAGAAIVGRTNLHELALGVTGVNPWFGTPVNPLDPGLVPGGSSSGSAVAVATGEADVAYGSDTGGSIRIPSACCGTAGLKTTWGRISLEGVWPLSPSFDTVGPMARDVAGLVTGMELLEPGFVVAGPSEGRDLRVGVVPVEADPAITAAVEHALRLTGWACTDVPLAAAWQTPRRRPDCSSWWRPSTRSRPVGRGPRRHRGRRRARLLMGSSFDDAIVRAAWDTQRAFARSWREAFERVRRRGHADAHHLSAPARPG